MSAPTFFGPVIKVSGLTGPQHVAADELRHYCNSNEVCAHAGLHSDNWILTHGMENGKFII